MLCAPREGSCTLVHGAIATVPSNRSGVLMDRQASSGRSDTKPSPNPSILPYYFTQTFPLSKNERTSFVMLECITESTKIPRSVVPKIPHARDLKKRRSRYRGESLRTQQKLVQRGENVQQAIIGDMSMTWTRRMGAQRIDELSLMLASEHLSNSGSGKTRAF